MVEPDYTARGDHFSTVMPAAVWDSTLFDADGRMVRSKVSHPSLGILRSQHLRLDAAGQALRDSNSVGKFTVATASYGGLGMLLRRTFKLPLVTGGLLTDTATYKLDGMANRTNMEDSLRTPWITQRQRARYRYDASGRLRGTTIVATRTDTALYDAAGNEIFTFAPGPDFTSQPTLVDRATWYGVDGLVRGVESRVVTAAVEGTNLNWTVTFDEYRYDPLGRRVVVRTQRECPPGELSLRICQQDETRRTVWDGAAELYEIRRPSSSAESDVSNVSGEFAHEVISGAGWWRDLNPRYGRVAYTYGAALDQPLSITRMNIAYVATFGATSPVQVDSAYTVAPHWDWRGVADAGTFADGSLELCATGGSQVCPRVHWQQQTHPFEKEVIGDLDHWFGSILEDKQDPAGLQFRRNRYLDASTGRFTQEDPIGLAGGMNLYGFAGGDPINFSDPMGLEPECVRCVVWLLARAGPAIGRIGAALTGLTAAGRASRAGSQVAAGIRGDGISSAPQQIAEVGRRVGDMRLGQDVATRAIQQAVTHLGLEQGPTVGIGGVNYVTGAQAVSGGIPAIGVDKVGATTKAVVQYGEKGWEVVKNLGAIRAPQ
jgi:RHS repeat-associated protein